MCRSVQTLLFHPRTHSPPWGASPGTHFTKGLWIHHADLVKKYFALITMAMIEIRLQICACHNSSAVVTFTKLSMIWFFDVTATWMLIHPLWNGSRCTAAPQGSASQMRRFNCKSQGFKSARSWQNGNKMLHNSLKFVLNGSIDNLLALLQIMVRHTNPSPDCLNLFVQVFEYHMMVSRVLSEITLLTHVICQVHVLTNVVWSAKSYWMPFIARTLKTSCLKL